jgi:hypothetical protein
MLTRWNALSERRPFLRSGMRLWSSLQTSAESGNENSRHLAGQSDRFAFAEGRARVQTIQTSKFRAKARVAWPGQKCIQISKENSTTTGTVKFYNDQKGFSVI